MKISMRREELFEAEAALKKLSTRNTELELSLIIAKNSRIVSQQVHDLREAMKPKFVGDEEKRQREYDEALFTMQRQFRSEPEKLQGEVDALQLKYSTEIFKRDQMQRKNNEFLQESTEVEIHEIPQSLLPSTLPADELGPMVFAVTKDGKPPAQEEQK